MDHHDLDALKMIVKALVESSPNKAALRAAMAQALQSEVDDLGSKGPSTSGLRSALVGMAKGMGISVHF